MFSLSAQTKSVDLDNLRCSISYRGIPSKMFTPRIPIVASYLCLFQCSPKMQGLIGANRVMDAMGIEGLEKVYNPSDADIYYQINMPDIHIVRERITGEEGSDYYLVMEYTIAASASLVLPSYYKGSNGEVLFNHIIDLKSVQRNDAGNEVYYSKRFKNREDAEEFWHENRTSVIKGIVIKGVSLTITKANSLMSNRFGFPAYKTNFNLIITDEDEHNEDADFRVSTQIVKAMFEGITADRVLQFEEVKTEIEYFNSVVDRYTDPKHKADIRLRYAALHNLFAIYYFLEDIENAKKYVRLLIQNGYETKKASANMRLITSMEDDFRKTGIATRHFSPHDIYLTEMHGNNCQQDPRSNVTLFLNNGYYDGYGHGRHGYENHDAAHGGVQQGGSHNDEHSQYGIRNGTGNGNSGSSNVSVSKPTQSTTAPSTATPSKPSVSRPTATPIKPTNTQLSRPTSSPAVSKQGSTSTSTQTKASSETKQEGRPQQSKQSQRPNKIQTGNR
jgi:hypothetical protein